MRLLLAAMVGLASSVASPSRAVAQGYQAVPISETGGRVAYYYPDAEIVLAYVRMELLGPASSDLVRTRRAAIAQAQRDVLVAVAVLEGELRTPLRGRIEQGLVIRDQRLPGGEYFLAYVVRRSSVDVRYCPACGFTHVVEGGSSW